MAEPDLMRTRFTAQEAWNFAPIAGDLVPLYVATARRSPDFHVRVSRRPGTSGLTLVLAGTGTWSCGGPPQPLGPGSFYASRQGSPLEVRCGPEGMDIRQIAVRGDGLPALATRELGAADGLWRLANPGECLRLLDHIRDEARGGGAQSGAIAADLIRALVRTAARGIAATTGRGSRAVYERARDLIEREPDVRPDLAAVAARCGVTVVHLCRAFRRHAGCPPGTWARDRRLDRAAARLAGSDAAVAAIAADLGWGDPYAFSRAFRRRFGIGPRAWRRQAGA